MNPQRSRYYTYIRPIIRSKVVQEYGPLIFSLVMVSFFSVFALRPTLTTIASLQKAIEEQTATKQKISEKIEALKLAKNNYLAINNQTKDKIDRLVPNDTALPGLIDQVRSLAEVYDASLAGIQFETLTLDGKPAKLVAKPSQKEIPFSLSVRGSYINLLQFVDALPKIDRVITIESINFRANEESDDLLMAINAKAYYFKH